MSTLVGVQCHDIVSADRTPRYKKPLRKLGKIQEAARSVCFMVRDEDGDYHDTYRDAGHDLGWQTTRIIL